MVWYTGVDQQRYDAGEKFLPQNRFLANYTPPKTNVEEEVTTSYGIPNTNAFTNAGGGGSGPTTMFSPYTAQLPGSFVTNRTNFGNTGYIQGTEPEETYMDKIGGLIKTGIGMAIPGGNFLMNLAENQARGNRLSGIDNAFIDMQMGIPEQSMHGGNLSNQDRYGYNKVSMFGNYADKVKERADIAREFAEKYKDEYASGAKKIRPIDAYYLEKEKELDETKKQVEFNDWMNQRITANKIRDLQAKGIDLGPSGTDIHGGDGGTTITTTDQNQTGDGWSGADWGDNPGGEFDTTSANAGTSEGWSNADWGSGTDEYGSLAKGGRVGLKYGGLASIL